MANSPRVAIYARVSTDEQSVDAQLRDLREYARNRGWHDVKEFVDVGISGAKDSRPAWNECWDAVQKGKTHVLLVHALDRLGRSLPHLVKILATLSERNITLVSYRENIDLSTAAGRMLAGLFSVLADYELSIIRERTKAGMRAAKARGSQIGNPRRFFDKQKAAELRRQGWGQIRIARELGIGVGRVNAWIRDEYVPPARRRKIKVGIRPPEDV
jgi:DNA invertase Pin-like site-specific DNA recombinase